MGSSFDLDEMMLRDDFPRRKEITFLKGRFSQMMTADIFPDCELAIDEEFRQLMVSTRGHEIVIELGDTEEWESPTTDEPFKGLKVRVFEYNDFAEESPIVSVHLKDDTIYAD